MNNKQRKTLTAVAEAPTSKGIVFSDIESMVKGLGGLVLEREGSRIRMELNGVVWRCHRPHPGKEAKRYQVDECREFLESAGALK